MTYLVLTSSSLDYNRSDFTVDWNLAGIDYLFREVYKFREEVETIVRILSDFNPYAGYYTYHKIEEIDPSIMIDSSKEEVKSFELVVKRSRKLPRR